MSQCFLSVQNLPWMKLGLQFLLWRGYFCLLQTKMAKSLLKLLFWKSWAENKSKLTLGFHQLKVRRKGIEHLRKINPQYSWNLTTGRSVLSLSLYRHSLQPLSQFSSNLSSYSSGNPSFRWLCWTVDWAEINRLKFSISLPVTLKYKNTLLQSVMVLLDVVILFQSFQCA